MDMVNFKERWPKISNMCHYEVVARTSGHNPTPMLGIKRALIDV